MTPEENELLTRTGPDPVRRVVRRYWQPAPLSEELPRQIGHSTGCHRRSLDARS